MAVTIDLLEDDIFKALGDFLTLILPNSVEIIRAQVNRVPSPNGTDSVVMNSSMRAQLWATFINWDFIDPDPTTMTAYRPASVEVQCDFHGPNAADNAWIFCSLFRSAFGCEKFKASNPLLQPLYVPDPQQIPFITGEDQYEDRWVAKPQIQANTTITVPQDFANALHVDLIDVDAVYPP